MARIFLSGIILAAFFLRDLRLLSSAGPSRIARASGIYSLFSGAYATLLAIGFGLVGVRRPDLISMGRNQWAGLVIIHVLLWGMTWLLSQTALRSQAWLLALAPSPALLLSQCMLVAVLPDNMANGPRPFQYFLIRGHLECADDPVRVRIVSGLILEPLCLLTVAIPRRLLEPLLFSLFI